MVILHMNPFTITTCSPRFQDAKFTVEGTMDKSNMIYDGKIETELGRETLTFTGRVAKEGTGSYSSSVRLSHPNTQTDIQFTGRVDDTRETLTGNMEFKWLMSTDQQFRISSLRTEINKLRREMNMDVSVHGIKLLIKVIRLTHSCYCSTKKCSTKKCKIMILTLVL